MESKKQKNRMVRPRVIFAISVMIGVLMLGYPTLSTLWNAAHNSSVITDYSSTINDMDDEKYQQIWEKAIEYNHMLAQNGGLIWPITAEEQSEYEQQLDISGTGSMGIVTIPKIGVNLPIYHGTGEDVIQSAVGHLLGTSLPVGNSVIDDDIGDETLFGSTCILSSHTGHPAAKLFTDLDQMEMGDLFYLTILDKVLTYEVDEITIVLPEDLTKCEIVPGKDFCSLVTCTPYGINSHRLVVRGHRITNEKGKQTIHLSTDAMKIDVIRYLPVLIIPVVIFACIYTLLLPSGEGKKNEQKENTPEVLK